MIINVTDLINVTDPVERVNLKGFLVQSRTAVDDSVVGTFTVIDQDNTRLSACSPRNVRFMSDC